MYTTAYYKIIMGGSGICSGDLNNLLNFIATGCWICAQPTREVWISAAPHSGDHQSNTRSVSIPSQQVDRTVFCDHQK